MRSFGEEAKTEESARGGDWAGWCGASLKRRANRENGRKGGLVKSRKKAIAARRNACRPRPGRLKKD